MKRSTRIDPLDKRNWNAHEAGAKSKALEKRMHPQVKRMHRQALKEA